MVAPRAVRHAMCQIHKGRTRPLEWQAPCSSTTTAVWQAPDVAELSRAIKRLPNFKAAPKIFLGDPLADTSIAMTTGVLQSCTSLALTLRPLRLQDVTRCFARRVPCHRPSRTVRSHGFVRRRVRVRMLLKTIAASRYWNTVAKHLWQPNCNR